MPRRSNLSLQYENQIYGSMMLLLDHMLLRNGGYSSKTVSFYEDTDSTWSSIYTYTSPYKQFAYDESLGVTAPTFTNGGGVIASRKLWKGSLLFSSKPTSTPTATVNVKDVNIYSSSRADEQVIFDSFDLSSVNNPDQGIPYESNPYPGVWLKINEADDKPFAFGGGGVLTQNHLTIRAVCVSDNPYTLDSVVSIFRSLSQRGLPLLSTGYSLFNDNYGGWDGSSSWNFTGEAHNTEGPWINGVNVSRINRSGPSKSANPNAISALVDFDLVYYKAGAAAGMGGGLVSYDNSYFGGVGNYNFSGGI